MDSITVVGLLAAVVQLIDVTSQVVNYFNNVKDAPKDRAKLAREATYLLPLFTELRYQVEERYRVAETTPMDPRFTDLRSLGGEGRPLMEFKVAMESIAKNLAPSIKFMNRKRVLIWTLTRKRLTQFYRKPSD